MDTSFDPNEVLSERDHEKRAIKILEEAEKLGLRKFLAPHDIVSGASRLNFAFVANLFNHAKHVKSNPTPRTLVPDSKASNSDLLAIIEKLTKENEYLKDENLKIKALLSDSDKLREKLIKLEKSSADADAESKKLRERLVALEKGNTKSASAENELLALRKKLEEAEKEHELLKKQQSDASNSKEHEEKLRELQDKLNEKEQDNKRLQNELLEKEAKYKKLRDEEILELVMLRKELTDREEKLKSLMNEKQTEIDKLNKELQHNQGTDAEKQQVEEKLREAELAVQDYEERLKILLASKTEDIIQEKALAEKRDNYMPRPLKDAKVNAKATGWLYKTGNRNKNSWKKRFFILKDNYLFYYNTDNEKKELKGKWIRLTEAKFEIVGDKKKKSNVFVIHPKELSITSEDNKIKKI